MNEKMVNKDPLTAYVGSKILEKYKELGITRYRFLLQNPQLNVATLRKLERGTDSVIMRNAEAVLEALGLCLKIVPIDEKEF